MDKIIYNDVNFWSLFYTAKKYNIFKCKKKYTFVYFLLTFLTKNAK